MDSVAKFFLDGDYQLLAIERRGWYWTLRVQPAEPRPGCPHCGAAAARQHRHGRRQRCVAHLPWGLRPCDLVVQFVRYRCRCCGRTHTPPLPGIGRRARLSDSLRELVQWLVAAGQVALQRLAGWLQLGWNSLWRCVRCAPPPDLSSVEHLCLDEVFWREPRQYLTVLSCADGRILGLAQGRGEQPSRQLLRSLPLAVREQVATLATDFSLGQRRAALDCLPNAEVAADCFHLVRLARRCWRETPTALREQARLAVGQLRELLRRREQQALPVWLERWRSASGPLHTLWKTVRQWELEIDSYLHTGRSTGPAEALNRRIALLRRSACGYTNLDNFTRRIMLLNCSSHPER